MSLILLTAGVLTAAAVVVSARRSGPGTIEVRLPEAATPTPNDGRVKVYVAGAVQRPGVYNVRAGDRVADAVEAAGGPADEADILVVNLARRLRDEDHIIVPRQGQSPVVGVPGSSRTNINAAAAGALETLPGIGPARAQRIVESRQRDGPFADPSDLVKRKLVPQSVFDSLKDLIDVRS